MPIKNVTLSNVRVGEVTKFVSQQENVEGVRVDTLSYYTSFRILREHRVMVVDFRC